MPKSKVRKPKHRPAQVRGAAFIRPPSAISTREPVIEEELFLRDMGFPWDVIDAMPRIVADGSGVVSDPPPKTPAPDRAGPARAAARRRSAARDATEELAYQAERAKVLAEATSEAVARARSSGLGWVEIGDAFGLTADGARYRWGR
jgi:hypothetical protein